MYTTTIDPRTVTFQRLVEGYQEASQQQRAAAHDVRRLARGCGADPRAGRRIARAIARLAQASDQLTHATAQVITAGGEVTHGHRHVVIRDARGRTRLTLTD